MYIIYISINPAAQVIIHQRILNRRARSWVRGRFWDDSNTNPLPGRLSTTIYYAPYVRRTTYHIIPDMASKPHVCALYVPFGLKHPAGVSAGSWKTGKPNLKLGFE